MANTKFLKGISYFTLASTMFSLSSMNSTFGMESIKKQKGFDEKKKEEIFSILGELESKIMYEIENELASGNMGDTYYVLKDVTKSLFEHFRILIDLTIEKIGKKEDLALGIQRIFSHYLRSFLRENKVDEKIKFFQNLFGLNVYNGETANKDFFIMYSLNHFDPSLNKINNEIYKIRFDKRIRSKEEIEAEETKLLVRFEKLIALCELFICQLAEKSSFTEFIDDRFKKLSTVYRLVVSFVKSLGYSEKQKPQILQYIKGGNKLNSWFKPEKKLEEKEKKLVLISFSKEMQKLGYKNLSEERLINDFKLAEKLENNKKISQKEKIKDYFTYNIKSMSSLSKITEKDTVFKDINKKLQEIIDKEYITRIFGVLDRLNRRSDIEERLRNSEIKKKSENSSEKVFQPVGTNFSTNYA